jgi:NAD+ synthase (glutamine-hydrolysing)
MSTAHGFVRVAAATPRVRVADPAFNAGDAVALARVADEAGAHVVVFPELNLTGYTCADLFQQPALQRGALAALAQVCADTRDCAALLVVGLPLAVDAQLFNCAAVVQAGAVLGIVPKTFIPGYKEYYEPRWFAPGTRLTVPSLLLNGADVPCGTDLLFCAEDNPALQVGVEICEDLWTPQPPSTAQALAGATLLLNLSASNELVAKAAYRRALVQQQSARCFAAYVLASAGVHESTTDMVFSGHALIAENGVLLAENERFARAAHLTIADVDVEYLQHERRVATSFSQAIGAGDQDCRPISFSSVQRHWRLPLQRALARQPFVPQDDSARAERCREIFAIQTAGLAKRLEHCGFTQAVVGVSGGLDSTLALLVCVDAFDQLNLPRAQVHAVTMPGYGTSARTYANVKTLCAALGVTLHDISITAACDQHFRDIGHDPQRHDIVFENTQARERTQILMNVANKLGALQVGTGDLSELALGWCTYNGDHMAMYSVNCGVPKTLVQYVIGWVAATHAAEAARRVLLDILATPISPELLPTGADGAIAQKTEDTLGPYELHDFFLYHAIRAGAPPRKVLLLACQAFAGAYDEATLRRWLRVFYTRFFAHQFKRSCVPDGPKVGSVSLSPRADWRMPSDASAAAWLAELDQHNSD